MPTGAGRISRRVTLYVATRACSLRLATSCGCRYSPAILSGTCSSCAATGSDYATLTEIRDAQRLIAAQDEPDLHALVELAVYRHAIFIRNQSIPVGLPAVWVRLARFDHAEALARAITNPRDQAQALTQLVSAAVQAGDSDRASRLAADAEALARTITDSHAQAQALTQLATVAAHVGDLDRAEALARTIHPIPTPRRRRSAS